MKQYLLIIALSLLLLGCTSNQPQVSSPSPTQLAVSTLQNTLEIKTGGNMVVENGDTVSVWYTGSTPDGKVFDTNVVADAKAAKIFQAARPYETLDFQVGAGQMIKGFDTGVLGMKIGETKTVLIPPKDGYGESNPQAIVSMPLKDLEAAGIDPVVGTKVQTQSGASGVVKSVNATSATIDFNHFLAGQTLKFKITVEKLVKNK
ncbi:peptidylprolyl isomerase [Candidatus Micrarchaeota archaeon]|nr:peptidylprolyl isomerase [Candidatus Micrarchaeota archaeon]